MHVAQSSPVVRSASDVPDTFAWLVTYTDGSTISDQETDWAAIAHPVVYDGLTLFVLTGEAESLSARVGECVYTLTAPELGTRFYRHFRGAQLLGAPISPQSTRIYHAIGYINRHGRVLLEIDGFGNAVRHFFPRQPTAAERAFLTSAI